MLLQALKRPQRTNPNVSPRLYISTDDHIKAFKKTKERVSAGMSKLHYGMFKAHIKRRHLAEMDASMRSIAYTTGYVHKRWKRGLDVQLLKRIALWLAEKMRTILLLEADLNMNNKAIGADAMRMGEANGWFERDNYGGRKGMQAVEVSLNAQLLFNSIWARRARAVIMSNDAKGCYDRIAHTVVILALRRLGIPKPALTSMIDCIQQMEHFIRTGFGDSETSYGNEEGPPPQGLLQGNGAGPAGWFSISTRLIKLLRDQGFGYKEWTLIRQRAVMLICLAYVDDTDLVHATTDTSKSTESLVQEAQRALGLWEGLLRATGGALAPEKSYWYLLEVINKNGQWVLSTNTNDHHSLHLKCGHTVQRLPPTTSKEALGIQVRPDASMEDEVTYLKQRVAKWCDGIRTRKFKGYEAWYCLHSTIMKTLEYPLAATTFTEDQVKEIMSPLLKVTLNLCGLQKRLPRPVLYGPLKERGCGLKDIFILQLAYHLLVLLKHQQRNTTTGDLLQEAMENIQFYVGSDQNFWDLPYEHYALLVPDGWMKFTWKCLSETQVTMRGPFIGIPTKRRYDTHLMDAFIQSDKIPDEHIEILQRCRLFLSATTLSDICTAAGTFIDLDVWEEKLPSARATPPFPTITPSKNDWIIWRSSIRKLFLHPISTSRELRQPLGPWNSNTPKGWTWFRNVDTDTLHYHNKDKWQTWIRTHTTGHTARYSLNHEDDLAPSPNSLQPVSVKRGLHHISVSTSGPVQTPILSQTPHSLTQAIRRLPPESKWAIQSLHVRDNASYVAQAIINHTALAVTDASLKMDLGTSAFIIVGKTNKNCVRAVNVVPGPIQEGDSHRCELSGAYGTLLLVEQICTLYQITTGTIRIACDNQRVVDALQPGFQPHPHHANFDLVSAVHHRIQQLPITVIGEHVKGHQDDQSDHTLTRVEQLNVAMDKLAKAYWIHIVTAQDGNVPLPPIFHIDGEGWQLYSGNEKITRPNTNTVYNTLYTPHTQYWWRRTHRVPSRYTPLPPEAVKLVDWPLVQHVFPKLPHDQRMWATKHASQNCGIGTTLQEWRFQDHATCPRCEHPQEDGAHVFRCQGNGADDHFQKSLNRLNSHLKKTFTHRLLRRGMIKALKAWHQGNDPTNVTTSPSVQRVLHEQTVIGWEHLFTGLATKQWTTFQQDHYNNQRSKRSGRKWMRKLLPQLIRAGKRQWLHRSKHKHQIGKPEEVAMRKLLNVAIIHQFQMGPHALLPGDKAKLDKNLVQLLQKPLHIRRAWWHNVHAARQRYERKRAHDDALVLESRQSSLLLKWIKDHQAST